MVVLAAIAILGVIFGIQQLLDKVLTAHFYPEGRDKSRQQRLEKERHETNQRMAAQRELSASMREWKQGADSLDEARKQRARSEHRKKTEDYDWKP